MLTHLTDVQCKGISMPGKIFFRYFRTSNCQTQFIHLIQL